MVRYPGVCGAIGRIAASRLPGTDRRGAAPGRREGSEGEGGDPGRACRRLRAGAAPLRRGRGACLRGRGTLFLPRGCLCRLRGGLYQKNKTFRGAGWRDGAGPLIGSAAVHAIPYGPDGRLHAAGTESKHRSGADTPGLWGQYHGPDRNPQYAPPVCHRALQSDGSPKAHGGREGGGTAPAYAKSGSGFARQAGFHRAGTQGCQYFGR